MLDVKTFWETAEVLAFLAVQGKVRAAHLKCRDCQSVGWVSSCELSHFGCCFIPSVRARLLEVKARLTGLKSQTFLLEEDDYNYQGNKTFPVLFLLAKLKSVMPDSFLNLCM